MTQATTTPEAQPGTQTPPPATPPAPTPDAAVAELSKKLDDLSKRIDEKDRYISELQTEKATLETRLSHTQPAPAHAGSPSVVDQEVTTILETAQTDPASAGRQLSQLLARTTDEVQRKTLNEVGPVIDRLTYINQVKAQHPDLIELGLEATIAQEVGQAMSVNPKADFRKTVDSVVGKYRQKVDKLKAPAAPTTPPADAMAETGHNASPPPAKKEAPPETEEQEIQRRKLARAARGL